VTLRCLIVDDSTQFLEAACALFEREGVAVVGMARSGAEALAWATQLRPDVALVDVRLGDESGFDVADRLADTPVIMISTLDEEDVAEVVAASRAVGFLSKSELSGAAIRGLLGGWAGGDTVSAPRGR
jgi:DNA-binding NarL/FixJ family response regulator